MFGHLVKYGFLSQMRSKEVVFWTLLFPFALCTFMYLAFGDIFETTEKVQVVPVAVVEERENQAFSTMMDTLSEKGENQVLQQHKASDAEAKKLLEEETVEGIIYVGEKVELVVAGSGIPETMLQMILDQYVQYETAIKEVVTQSPEKVVEIVQSMMSDVDYLADTDMKGNQDNVTSYFYAVIAMACLFCSYAGCEKALKIQGNLSPLGQRRNVAPTHKMKVIVADFAATFMIQYVILILLFVYMKWGLKLEIGDDIPAILLLLLMGSAYGVFIGFFVGCLPGLGEGMKVGILTTISLSLCVMADLMAQGIKISVEHHAPILNDINPAVLISDSLYALNVFGTYDRFYGNIVILGIGLVVLAVASYLMIRRNRYASL